MEKNVLEKMERIVKVKVNFYKSDFYEYDLPVLKKEPGHYIWIARPHGTFLYKYENASEIHDYYYKDLDVDFYDVTINADLSGDIKKIPFVERGSVKTFHVGLYDMYDNCVKRYTRKAWTKEDCLRMENSINDSEYFIKVS